MDNKVVFFSKILSCLMVGAVCNSTISAKDTSVVSPEDQLNWIMCYEVKAKDKLKCRDELYYKEVIDRRIKNIVYKELVTQFYTKLPSAKSKDAINDVSKIIEMVQADNLSAVPQFNDNNSKIINSLLNDLWSKKGDHSALKTVIMKSNLSEADKIQINKQIDDARKIPGGGDVIMILIAAGGCAYDISMAV